MDLAPLEHRVVERERLKDLQCAICMGVMREPVQCKNGHLFCRKCIRQSIRANPKCPICRCSLTEAELARSLFVERHLASLLVWCPHHFTASSSGDEFEEDADGCDVQLPNETMDKHSVDCGYALVWCTYSKQCGKVRRRAAAEHRLECDYRPVECEHCHSDVQAHKLAEHVKECHAAPVTCGQCGGEVRRGELSFHVQRFCPDTVLDCPYGCSERVVRHVLPEHLRERVVEHLEHLRTANDQARSSLEATFLAELQRRDAELEVLKRTLRPSTKLVWTIQNWSEALRKGAYVQSASFEFEGYTWFFGVYTNGDQPEAAGYLSLYLFQEDPPSRMKSKSIGIDLILYIGDMQKEIKGAFPVKGGQGWGERRVMRNAELTEAAGTVVQDRLLIEIEMFRRRTVIKI